MLLLQCKWASIQEETKSLPVIHVLFSVCVFLIELAACFICVGVMLHRVLTNCTYLSQRKVRIPPTTSAQSWVHRFDCDVLKLHGFHLHVDLHCQSDVIRLTNPSQCYWTFYMQSTRLLIIPWVNINIICWSSI